MITKDLYYVYNNYFSKKFCDEVIKYGKSKILETARLSKDKINFNVRKSKTTFFTNELWITKELNKLIENANEVSFNFDIERPETIQFTEYSTTEHYTWHCDPFPITEENKNNLTRKLSLTVALNDGNEYKQGFFQIKENDKIHQVEQLKNNGTVVVFPSYQYHRVLPVLKGVRYSLVSWYLGKRFR